MMTTEENLDMFLNWIEFGADFYIRIAKIWANEIGLENRTRWLKYIVDV